MLLYVHSRITPSAEHVMLRRWSVVAMAAQDVFSSTAGSALIAHLEILVLDCRCWGSLRSGMSAEEITAANDVMLERQEAEFAMLKRLESLVTAAEEVFPGAAAAKELDPAATADAESSENEAAENAQVSLNLPMQSFLLLCRDIARGVSDYMWS